MSSKRLELLNIVWGHLTKLDSAHFKGHRNLLHKEMSTEVVLNLLPKTCWNKSFLYMTKGRNTHIPLTAANNETKIIIYCRCCHVIAMTQWLFLSLAFWENLWSNFTTCLKCYSYIDSRLSPLLRCHLLQKYAFTDQILFSIYEENYFL